MGVIEKIKHLKLDEKAVLLQGKNSWQTYNVPKLTIPTITMSDGPNGLRTQEDISSDVETDNAIPSTCYPTASAMACSWDIALCEELGGHLGMEASANNVNILLGPGLNIKRSPMGGRNFEYFSEDPYLSGKIAAAYVRGVQFKGIASCIKHFACNNQETFRMCNSSSIDERTLREIYLTGFEIAVKEGKAKAIMSSYNKINGVYSNENPYLLKNILRNEWGFNGVVISDWGADNDRSKSVSAGCNLVMPNPGLNEARELVENVKNGKVSESEIDARLFENITLAVETDAVISTSSKVFSQKEHHNFARKCAEGSIVLLENDGILPLDIKKNIALIGKYAIEPRYQGSGSSKVNAILVDDLFNSLNNLGVNIKGFAKGYGATKKETKEGLILEACELAKNNDIVIVSLGMDEMEECEGKDRTTFDLPNDQVELLREVSKVNQNIVLVLSGGSPFAIPRGIMYRAIVNGNLTGEASGSAMANVLTGIVNPSGKLAETWPIKLEDTPSYEYYLKEDKTALYKEGIYVGYRYYDTKNVPVKYPFGYGLSYTNFEYSNLEVKYDTIYFDIKNVGDYDGSEVVQLYVSCKNSNIYRPNKELKGFKKIFIRRGETVHVTMAIDDKTFRYFDTEKHMFMIEDADYEIQICSNVSKVELKETVHVKGETPKNTSLELPSYYSADIKNVSDLEFEKLLGFKVSKSNFDGKIKEDDPVCYLRYSKSLIGKFIYRKLEKKKQKMDKSKNPDRVIYSIYEIPFKGIRKFLGGKVNKEMTDEIIRISNGEGSIFKLMSLKRKNKKENERFLEDSKLIDKLQ